ncbi:MAG: radical SAM protein, partial [Desulfatitalea sp.]|nr:radical SAM protein [Desulfatitalea sp.]
ASATTNDIIRGQGSFAVCTQGIRHAGAKGFRTSLIYTVSRLNLAELAAVPSLLAGLKVDRFFIQVIGLRGQSAANREDQPTDLQVSRREWEEHVLPAARQVASQGIPVIYPKVYLAPGEPFACAGRVADNYFIFPNGRVYRCPLCEDFPLHSLLFDHNRLIATAPINETGLFQLEIPEGCVMNKLIQPGNLSYAADGRPNFQIACCLLKEAL